MHHLVLDQWSRGGSWIHHLDARAKTVCTLILLVQISTAPPTARWLFAADLAALASLVLLARLPLKGVLARAAIVVPLSLTFALMLVLGGDWTRAEALVIRTYLSALCALLLVGTTSLPRLLDGLHRLGVPRLIILTAQFLYRYLFLLAEQAQHMRIAAAARSAGTRSGPAGIRHAAGMVAILFARSYERADGIYRAMRARGFDGRFHLLEPVHLGWKDGAAVAGFLVFCTLLRWSLVSW